MLKMDQLLLITSLYGLGFVQDLSIIIGVVETSILCPTGNYVETNNCLQEVQTGQVGQGRASM